MPRQQFVVHRPGDVECVPNPSWPLVPTRSVSEITGRASEIAILAVAN